MAKLYYRHSADEKEAVKYALLEYNNAVCQGMNVILASPVDVSNIGNILKSRMEDVVVIILMNAHLCEAADAEYVANLCKNSNITVVCYGRRIDEDGHAYPGAASLLPFADVIERIETEPDIETEIEIDPLLMDFLDASSYEKKLDIFARMNNIDDDMINTMAVALDIQVRPGTIEERKSEIKKCLLTMEKYECTRLR